jgi:hypothetical protein
VEACAWTNLNSDGALILKKVIAVCKSVGTCGVAQHFWEIEP